MPFLDEWLVPTLETAVPEEAMTAIREAAETTPTSLWEQIVQRRIMTDDQVLAAISARFRLPLADLTMMDPKVRDSVPEGVARKHNVLPLRITDSTLDAATANPFDIDAEKMLAFATGREVRLLLSSPSRIRDRLEELYRGENLVSKLLGGLETGADVQQIEETQLDEGASADEASQKPIVRLVDMMLADGVTSRASDIHVEPIEGGVTVRYRIDGVLRQVMTVPRAAGIPLISRIKIMSGLDIADRLRPQDGRARIAINNDKVDLRVSTLPATYGEKVVIRILNQKSTILSLQTLGLFAEERLQVERLLGFKEGIILVTGPTGSGKTTTLYSALRMIQSEGVNIVTIEDPVEFRLGKHIVQVQINEKAGLTFATALRSILRQDPDVVLVGEIRDGETAQIAVQASLTGHLVLSTLHTNDAPNSVTRLVDMGMQAYKIGAALRGVIAQRLMRRLCLSCRVVQKGPVPERVMTYFPAGTTLYEPKGCPDCTMTGYKGRFSIVEILTMSPELERLIGQGATVDMIATAARHNGMMSLFESGLRHVLEGDSSVDELLRVTDIPLEGRFGASGAKPGALGIPSLYPTGVFPTMVQPGTAAPAAPAAPSVDLATAFELLDEPVTPVPGTGPSRGVSVLLVDDEDQLRRVMKDLLEREGYLVHEARDGVQALDQVDRVAPDIIVLDLNLPGLDGYAVLAQLRSRPTTQGIPVIVLTAKGDEDNEVRVFELGADDFLTKPFRARALSARLDAVLSRRRTG
ncbi:MAG TPA: type II/IV secretion system protein [Gemmatimonadales bacterium]|nr:type II/IV secretion system protein [Gemmatimonadales bacterium]